MNVFDLPGPQFLVFYMSFGAAVGACAYAILWAGSRRGGRLLPLLADPFQIAYLRGGPIEAARIAVISLVDRGLVDVQNGRLVASTQPPPRDMHPIERAVLAGSGGGITHAMRVLSSPPAKAACRSVADSLIRLGLAPTDEARRGRATIAAVAGLLVIGVGIIKLAVAIDRGRSNIWFLVVLMVVAFGFFAWLGFPRWRTGQGKRMLDDLRRLLSGRRATIRGKPTTSELLLFAGAFGASGLAGYSQLQAAYAGTRPQSSSSNCGSSSCGSSSGGCGGGGGCGGCGSG